MKVLILTNSDVGLYKFRKELLERLLNEGSETLVSLPEGAFTEALKRMGCKYIRTGFKRRGKNPFEDAGLLSRYIKLLSSEKPDAVLTYTIKPNVYGGLACRLTGTPYIANVTGLGTTIENPGMLQKLALALYKAGLKKADCVFFQNKANLEFFQKNILPAQSHARLLSGSGVNLSEHRYEEYPGEADGVRFLFIGRIMKDKGVEELFEAAERIKARHTRVKFSVIGECDEDYSARITELEKSGIIEPLGFQRDVHSFIKNSHCTVLPSYHEGMANVLLESAACGRPVIAARVAGCSETFDDGVSGLGCDVRSVDSLVEAIERFLSMSPAEHEAMGMAGRAKMEKEFDRRSVVNAYMEEIVKAASRA